jgi:hypothetical protein
MILIPFMYLHIFARPDKTFLVHCLINNYSVHFFIVKFKLAVFKILSFTSLNNNNQPYKRVSKDAYNSSNYLIYFLYNDSINAAVELLYDLKTKNNGRLPHNVINDVISKLQTLGVPAYGKAHKEESS